LFYYLGHGATDKVKGHYLEMKTGRLYRKDLREAMARKNPRLQVLLTDSCAAYLPAASGGSPLGGEEAALPRLGLGSFWGLDLTSFLGRPGAAAGREKALSQLLFHQKGVVDINSSRTGTLAYVDLVKGGGYFSVTLMTLFDEGVSAFDSNGDGRVDWSEFYAVLQTKTERATAQGTNHKHSQTTIAFELSVVP
jgi:hypothetical protein